MTQLGDRLVFVRTIDGQPLLGKIRAADWQDDPNTGAFVLHWPLVYVEQAAPAKDGKGMQVAFRLMPPMLVAPTPKLEVRYSQRVILDEAAVKKLGEVYDHAQREEQARDSGIVLPSLVPCDARGNAICV